MEKLLLVDDEDQFRTSMAARLKLRGYQVIALSNGEDAVKVARSDPDIDVVILDLKMPGMNGDQALREIKTFRPEMQAIFLTGQGSIASAMEVGRLDAYAYLEKPCEFEKLVETVEGARRERVRAMERHEIPHVQKGSLWKWLVGSHNSRPGVLIFGLVLFFGISYMPTPQRMTELLSYRKTGDQKVDINLGYSSWSKMKPSETIAEYYARTGKLGGEIKKPDGKKEFSPIGTSQVARRAKMMLGLLLVCALFWATGAVPVGITALIVGLAMYFGDILKPDDIAQAYAKDAVIFIFGVLSVAVAITKTGLDRRIGLLLLGTSTSLWKLLFIFLPLMAVACSFMSEHALVAFMMPVVMLAYSSSVQAAGLKRDRALAVMFILAMCFAANCGGPGSPAAGGRNAVMVGILSEYGVSINFLQWVKYGLPFVPVMALVIAAYFFLTFRRKIKVKNLNISAHVRAASERIGPMNKAEYVTAAILIILIAMWCFTSEEKGMGGPVLLAVIALNVFRILRWKDIAKIQWEVVALYASACAIGKGLAISGAALYLADTFVNAMPAFMKSGEGLAVASSIISGIITNFMSDGATVSAVGPITVPMGIIAGTHPWMVGLATAFASSFAHTMIIGTPNNAIAYAMAKDPITGEQLLTLGDFFRHGTVILLLSFAVLWGWCIFGYWRWIGFPS
jgi:sodium-dependent dicarboxylate transporter 2/3/5